MMATRAAVAFPIHETVSTQREAAIAAYDARVVRNPGNYDEAVHRAACLYESARAGKRVALTGDIETVMAGLSCGETSLLAWPIVRDGAEFFAIIPDQAALDTMRLLADGVESDPPVVAGESATAGLAGVLAAMADPKRARELGLGPESRVLVFGTEGDTDPELYEKIVGRSADQVRSAA